MFENEISRRRLLVALGSAGAIAGLPSCAHWQTGNVCSPDLRTGDPNKPLTIDMHAHVFNASDVHVNRLLTDVIGRDSEFKGAIDFLSGAIQSLLWTHTPDYNKEMRGVARLKEAFDSCQPGRALPDGGVKSIADDLRRERYDDTVQELRNANARQARSLRTGQAADIARLLDDLPEADTYFETGPRLRALRARGREVKVDGVLAFIICQGQYRCLNWLEYVRAIGSSPKRDVDLAVGHLLDFDWPLGGGSPTATSVQDQIKLMSQITILSRGRIHGFAPFCPMRAVMHRGPFSPLEMAQDAVQKKGFIGIKIYPPMGFAPYGNGKIHRQKPDFWQRTWLPDSLRAVPDLGDQLDGRLAELYQWCEAFDVPIMTHTIQSMGTCDDFEELATARHWKEAIALFPRLRVNFGHFGDPLQNRKPPYTKPYIDLMRKAGQRGENLYADSGYFSEVLSRPKELSRKLAELQNYSLAVGSAPLYDRLMFGTDWNMASLIGQKVRSYLSSFETVLQGLDPSASDRFFGANAATFLGLRQNGRNRERLDQFYSLNGIPTPLWMRKIDKPQTAPRAIS